MSGGFQGWCTPPSVFELLDSLLGPFTLDAAASDDWHLCPNYFTEQTDGLKSDWGQHTVFINPPFDDLATWLAKAAEHQKRTGKTAAVLGLSSTSSRWFHKAWEDALILIPDRRINYWHPTKKPGSFDRDSAVYAFTGEHQGLAVRLEVPPHHAEIRKLWAYTNGVDDVRVAG